LKNFINSLPADNISVVGEALSIYPQVMDLDTRLQRPKSPKDLPLAITLIHEAKTHQNSGWTKDWKDFHPLYIRASEAEENSRFI
jgi:tRNA A37 threonylcarbamoyladenosine modification protein TsaB